MLPRPLGTSSISKSYQTQLNLGTSLNKVAPNMCGLLSGRVRGDKLNVFCGMCTPELFQVVFSIALTAQS